MTKGLVVMLALILLVTTYLGVGVAVGGDDGVLTLTAFIDEPATGPLNWKWGDDPTSRWITEQTGIRIEVTCAADDTGTQLATMLASGEKLPDFIQSRLNKPSRRQLIAQEFVLPLNKLADEYYPEFWDVLPEQMDTLYTEDDGNLYLLTDWYGAPNREDEIGELNNNTPISININKAIYEEMGSPDISTWEKFVAHLADVKEQHPEIGYIFYDQYGQITEHNRSMPNLVARLFGAQNDFYEVNSDSSLTLLPRTQAYHSMLEECNKLFRAGIINPEMYTHAFQSDQQREVMLSRNFYAYCGNYWAMIEMMSLPMEEEYFTIDFPLPEGVDKAAFHVHNDFLYIGHHTLFVTADTEHPAECIKYLAFLLSDEGQYAQRYGTEGISFVFDEDGIPVYTEAKNTAEAEGFDVLQRTLGVHNYNFAWLTQMWVASKGAQYTYPYEGILNHFRLVTPYMKGERLADMSWDVSGEDNLVLKEQIVNIWRAVVPQIITAADDAAFEAAYNKFMSDLEAANVSKLEEVVSENRVNWISRGLEAD